MFHIFHKWILEDDNTRVCSCGKMEHKLRYNYCGQGDDGNIAWISHKEYIQKLANDEIAHAEKNEVRFKDEIEKVRRIQDET